MTIEERLEALEMTVGWLTSELKRVQKVTDLHEPCGCARPSDKQSLKNYDDFWDSISEEQKKNMEEELTRLATASKELQIGDSFPFRGRLVYKGWRKPSEYASPWAEDDPDWPTKEEIVQMNAEAME